MSGSKTAARERFDWTLAEIDVWKKTQIEAIPDDLGLTEKIKEANAKTAEIDRQITDLQKKSNAIGGRYEGGSEIARLMAQVDAAKREATLKIVAEARVKREEALAAFEKSSKR